MTRHLALLALPVFAALALSASPADAYPTIQCRDTSCVVVDSDFARPAEPVLLASLDLPAAPQLAAAVPDAAPAAIGTSPSAAPADRAAEDPAGFLGDVVKLARSGAWLAAIGGVLILLMQVLKLTPVTGYRWFQGDRGHAILLGLVSLLGALGTSFMSGAPLDGKMLLAALASTWVAAGGYTWVRRLLWPKDHVLEPADPSKPVSMENLRLR